MRFGRRPARAMAVVAGVVAAGVVVAAVYRGRPAAGRRATVATPDLLTLPEAPPPAVPAAPPPAVPAAPPPVALAAQPVVASAVSTADGGIRPGSWRRSGLAAAVVLTAALGSGVAIAIDRTGPTAVPTAAVSAPLPAGPALGGMPVPPSAPPVPVYSPPPLPVPAGDVVPVRQTVIMEGASGEEMHLTLVSVEDPAPYRDPDLPDAPDLTSALGNRLVTAIIRIENTGGVPFLDDIENRTRLVDTDGREHEPDVAMTESRNRDPASRLDPRYVTARQIVFEVKGGVDLTRLRVSLRPGSAGGTQDWVLT